MPELPEVETTKRGIAPLSNGQTIQQCLVRQPKLRWPVPDVLTQNRVAGLGILNILRRGKYLILETPQGDILIHLGMSGNLRILPHGTPVVKHDHIDLILENGYLIRYHDPRRFGAWLWADKVEGGWQQHPLIAKLGPEPLSDDFNADYLSSQISRRKSPIKTLIMNSPIVVGVGNIYANESLFMSGIHPQTLPSALKPVQLETLVANIKKVLAQAIEQGGTTLKDFLTPDGKPGYFEQQLSVYGREGKPCPQCGTSIEKRVLNQRAAYFCPQCQPLVKLSAKK
jgi:formamidopyrimidine-DNA glycosylase